MTQQSVGMVQKTPHAERVRHIENIEFSPEDPMEEALSAHARLAQLQGENLRLQRLVGELLIKNQQLRELR